MNAVETVGSLGLGLGAILLIILGAVLAVLWLVFPWFVYNALHRMEDEMKESNRHLATLVRLVPREPAKEVFPESDEPRLMGDRFVQRLKERFSKSAPIADDPPPVEEYPGWHIEEGQWVEDAK